MITYEQQLTANPMWAVQEGSMHFERESAVFKTLTKIARRLDESVRDSYLNLWDRSQTTTDE